MPAGITCLKRMEGSFMPGRLLRDVERSFPKILVPLTCDVIGKGDEHQGRGEQTFKSDVVRVDVPGENKYLNGKKRILRKAYLSPA